MILDPVTKEWVELEPEVKHEESTPISPEVDDSANNISHSSSGMPLSILPLEVKMP